MLRRMVRITFSIDGIVGRETYAVRRVVAFPEHMACFALEEDMITAGVQTLDCGCCIEPGVVRFLATEVLPEAPC